MGSFSPSGILGQLVDHDQHFAPAEHRIKEGFARGRRGKRFGLYLIEAMAAGVPVVQPRHAAFPELIAATGGGVIAEVNAAALATAIEGLLLDPTQLRALGEAGRRAVSERFTVDRMAGHAVQVFASDGIYRRIFAPTAARCGLQQQGLRCQP